MSLRRLLPALALASVALAACSSTGNPWPGIAADAERAYVAFGPAVYGLNLDTGQEVWRYPQEPVRNRMFYAAPEVTESGLVIIGSYDKQVFALEADTGQEVWTFDEAQERIVGGAVASGETVYVPSADGLVFALDADSGEFLWSFDAEGQVWASPLVTDDRVYVGSLSHVVYALDRASGQPVWNRDVGGAIVDSPSLVDGTLVVGALGRPLTALDPANGEPRWTAESDRWIWASATSTDGVTYFGDLGGRLAAASVMDGALLHQIQLESAITGRPAVGEGLLFVATESGSVHALHLDDLGSEWVEVVPSSKLYGPPVLQDQTLLIGVVGRELLVAALDASGGNIRWRFQP
ncbi:MAG TPA: PQQ-binding-like beta-propeller repeat protein [Anaerolineales bacterium]|nr:PQQ-binding-like beta-propeller repeat protein [Anaerolineales bacterium]